VVGSKDGADASKKRAFAIYGKEGGELWRNKKNLGGESFEKRSRREDHHKTAIRGRKMWSWSFLKPGRGEGEVERLVNQAIRGGQMKRRERGPALRKKYLTLDRAGEEFNGYES